MTKDNVIFRDSNGFNVSDGKTDHKGVEYELAWSPLETLTFAAAGTYAEHKYDFNRSVDGGETIVKPVEWHGSGHLSALVGTSGLFVQPANADVSDSGSSTLR